MPAKVMLAPNPNRSMKVDRVIIIGKSEDGARVSVLSIHELHKHEDVRKRFYKYFTPNAHWNLLALIILLAGLAAAFFWHWWIAIIAFLVAGRAGWAGKSSAANSAERILRENEWARDHFAQLGLIWDAPVSSVVDA